MTRPLFAVFLAALILTLSTVTYTYIGAGSHQARIKPAHKTTTEVQRPLPDRPISHLPGTLYLTTSDGSLLKLHQGTFSPLQGAGGWTQPSASHDGKRLLIVNRSGFYSDIYVLDLEGQPQAQVLSGAGRYIDQNHWAFYPRFSPEDTTVYFSRDDPKGGYEVDLSIWAMPVGAGNLRTARRWSDGTSYTGGDLEPIPLASGALLYTSYSFGPDGTVHSQLWVSPKPFSGHALTNLDESCSEPALSPDGTRLAMVCTGNKQVGRIVVAHFDGNSLDSSQVVLDGVLAARPTWAPDGSGLAFLAPEAPEGLFELWWLPIGQTPAAQPVQLTIGYEFDAASTIAWIG